MPAHRKRPAPPVRMVELLVTEKAQLVAAGLPLTEDVFEVAWERCWQVMVSERAWPHATEHRRSWRRAMEEAMKPEARACFLGLPSGFQRYQQALAEASRGMLEVFASEDILVGQLVA